MINWAGKTSLKSTLNVPSFKPGRSQAQDPRIPPPNSESAALLAALLRVFFFGDVFLGVFFFGDVFLGDFLGDGGDWI